jgi:hypothetical protein
MNRLVRAVLVGGALVAVLDALDAVIVSRLALGLDPVSIYQFVASGLLGPAAYQGGAATALLGVAVHCAVALSAAATFSLAAVRLPVLLEHAVPAGLLHGLVVYAVMNGMVIPLSRIPPAPLALPLFVNGVLAHALLVGLPAALAARHYLGNGAARKLAPSAT